MRASALQDKRRKPRQTIQRTVQAVTVNDTQLAVDCTLLDISQSGARLYSAGAATLPREFVLVLRDDIRKWCRVVRRAKNDIGVRFIEKPQI